MLGWYRWSSLCFSALFSRPTTFLSVALSSGPHHNFITEPNSLPTERFKTSSSVVRKYKKLLQDLMQSGSFGEDLAFLKIADITPMTRKGHFEVRCVLPSLFSINQAPLDSHTPSLALKLQQLMNANTKEIRSKVCQNRVEYKWPTFHFIVEMDTEQNPNTTVQTSDELRTTGAIAAEQSAARFTVIKPSNVYGLPRDELVRKVRSGLKDKNHSIEPNSDCEFSPKPVTPDPIVTAEWAKLWKQRQDWRSQARRERKRARQNIGLYRLTMGQQGMTIMDFDSDED